MKIHYLECLDKKKLFSFYEHDYREYFDKKGNYYMIDGGFNYQRYSHPVLNSIPSEGKLYVSPIKEAEISECIKDIREQFTWTKRYNKRNQLLKKPVKVFLKDLATNHIIGILKYFTEKVTTGTLESKEDSIFITREWKLFHLIFIEELLYRKIK